MGAVRAVEALLLTAILASLGAGLLARTRVPRHTPTKPATSIPIDVARDPPWLLRLLPGIGPARARAIVEDRATLGPVSSLGGLDRIHGLGKKSVEVLRRAGAIAGRIAEEPPRTSKGAAR